MKKIYLDYNVILELLNKTNNDEKNYIFIRNKIKENSIFYYSYGHIEEINCNVCQDGVKKRLEILSEITENNEILFSSDSYSYSYIKEHVNTCYSRVKTPIFHNKIIDEASKVKNKIHIDEYNKIENTNLLNNYSNELIFLDNKEKLKSHMEKNLKSFLPNVYYSLFYLSDNSKRDHINKYKECYGLFENIGSQDFKEKIKEFLKYPRIFELLMEHIFDFLYEIGFWKENFKKATTYRSKVFDVTHAIFASKTDILFTMDKRFYHKLQVVYDFLGIETKLIFLKEKDLEKILIEHC